MKKEDIIHMLEEIEREFHSLSIECEDQKDRISESYFNGYQACCDDIHYTIYRKISELYQTPDE